MRFNPLVSLVVAILGVTNFATVRAAEPGPKPSGEMTADLAADEIRVGNDSIAGAWTVAGGGLRAVEIVDRLNGRHVKIGDDAFELTIGGELVKSSDLTVVGTLTLESLKPNPTALRRRER